MLLQRQDGAIKGVPSTSISMAWPVTPAVTSEIDPEQRIPSQYNADGPQSLVTALIKYRNGDVQDVGSK